MKRLAATLALTFTACGEAPIAPPPEAAVEPIAGDHLWIVDAAQSELVFRGTQQGESFQGRFENWDSEINLDPADLSDARIRVRVRPASAVTGDGERDGALPGRDWFDAERFPEAVFESDDVEATGGNAYVARGTLSLKGMERPLELPFTLDIAGDTARAEVGITLDRSEYGVGANSFATDQWIAFPVEVEARLVAERAG